MSSHGGPGSYWVLRPALFDKLRMKCGRYRAHQMGIDPILAQLVDSGATLTLATLVFLEVRSMRALLTSTLEKLLERIP